MREFDHTGLLLAEFQAKLFEKSYELNCSSPVFLRRFLHSDLLKELDSENSVLMSLSVVEGIQSMEDQFGPFNYGKEKYSKSALFWMGYMYRYIAYTRDESTHYVMKIFKHKQMNEVYYTYHTQSPEWCIDNLLEINHLTKDALDKNARLKNIIRAYQEKESHNL